MKKTLSLLLTAVLLLAVLCGCGAAAEPDPAPAQAAAPTPQNSAGTPADSGNTQETPEEPAETSFTLIDASGREVTLDCPRGGVTKVAVINRYNLELLRATGHLDEVVGVDSSIIENSVYWPEFRPEQSYGNQQEPNYELIAAMEPNCLLTPFVTDELVAAMEPFGIPVVSLIGYSTDLNAQVDIIEAMFGVTEKAEAFRAFYTEVDRMVDECAAKIPEAEKKTAIWESIKEYSPATGKNDWNLAMLRAGVADPFADIDLSNAQVDAEGMINANPDFIFKMVAGTGLDLSGYTPPSDDDYAAAAAAYTARPGFEAVKAVEDGNVYFVTSFCYGGMGKLISSCYVGSIVYPEYFADLDPDAVFKTWMEDYQNISFVSGHTARLGDIQ